jgi:hypothetical protein
MNILQQYQLLIGIFFAFLLVIFFMVAFFAAPNMTSGQHAILRFLAALCAGFAGALIAGEALFRMEGDTGATKYLVSGTAGFALFFVVWFFFPKYTAPATPVAPDSFSVSIPKGWTFQHAAKVFAQKDKAIVDFGGLTANELTAKLSPTEIEAKTVSDAINRLRLITVTPNAIRQYNIKHKDSVYHLTVRS